MFRFDSRMLFHLLIIFGVLNAKTRAYEGRNWCKLSLVFSSNAKVANAVLHYCPEGGTIKVYDFNDDLIQTLDTNTVRPYLITNISDELGAARLFQTHLNISLISWSRCDGKLGRAEYRMGNVLLSQAELTLNPRWIENSLSKIGELPLQQAILPGMANPGLYPFPLGDRKEKDFKNNIVAELIMGARVLYVNLCLDGETCYICENMMNTFVPFSLDVLMLPVREFLKAFPNELVIYVIDVIYDRRSISPTLVEEEGTKIIEADNDVFNKSTVQIIFNQNDAKQTLNELFNKGVRVIISFGQNWFDDTEWENPKATNWGRVRVIKGFDISEKPIGTLSVNVLTIQDEKNQSHPIVEPFPGYKEQQASKFSVRMRYSPIQFISSLNLFAIENFGSTESVVLSIEANLRKLRIKKQYERVRRPREEVAYMEYHKTIHKYIYNTNTMSWKVARDPDDDGVVKRCGKLSLTRTCNKLRKVDVRSWLYSERSHFLISAHNITYATALRPDWMGQYLDFINDVSIFNLCIPGTHFSGVWREHPYTVESCGLAHRQREDIITQLAMGIRAFQFGVQAIKKNSSFEFWVHDVRNPVRRLEPLLQDMATYLNAFLDELIFIELGRFSNFTDGAYEALHTVLQQTFGDGSIFPHSQSRQGITFRQLRNRAYRVVITSSGLYNHYPRIYFPSVAYLLNKGNGTIDKDLEIPLSRSMFIGYESQTSVHPRNIPHFHKKYPGGFEMSSIDINFNLACEFNTYFEKGKPLENARIMYIDFFENSNIVDSCITNNLLGRNIPELFRGSLDEW